MFDREDWKVEIAQDKIDLIEKIIRNDRKFANNEDLFEDFLNETCKRSMLILSTINSDTVLEAYLKKIATTSILNVLKSEGRLRRTKAGYTPTKEVSIEEILPSSIPDYSNINVSYMPVKIQETPEDLVVKKEVLQKITDAVSEINDNAPEKNYLELYNLRYSKGLTQKEIALELNLSQSEVSKRLFRLMDKVKQIFNQDL